MAPGVEAGPAVDPRRWDERLRDVRILRRPPHRSGWSDGIRTLARGSRAVDGEDPDHRRAVRAAIIAAAVGVDARQTRQFPRLGAFFVTTDREGIRLLLGGVLVEADATPTYRARVLLDATLPLGNIRGSGIGPVAIREDGMPFQLVAQAGRDGRPDRLELIDLGRGEPVTRFDLAGRLTIEYFHELALAPDAAVAGAPVRGTDGKVRLCLWDAGTGRRLHELEFPGRCTAFAPGRSLAAAGDDSGRVRVWSLGTGGPVASYEGDGAPIRRLVFGPDPVIRPSRDAAGPGWRLATADAAGTIAIRAVAAEAPGAPAPRVTCEVRPREVTGLAFSPDGSLLATCAQDGARLFDPATGRLLLSIDTGEGLQCLAFAPQGRHLAFCTAGDGDPGTTSIWAIRESGGIGLLRGLAGRVALAITSPEPGGALAAAYATDGKIGLWDRRRGMIRSIFPVPGGPGAGHVALAFSPDRGRLAFAGGGEARLWDTATGKEIRRWTLPGADAGGAPGRLTALAFAAPDELRLHRLEAGPSRSMVIRIRNLLGPAPLAPLAEIADFRAVRGAVVTPDGAICIADGVEAGIGPGMVASPAERVVNGYDGRTGKRLWSVPLGGQAGTEGILRLDPTGKVLALPCDRTGPAPLVDAATGKTLGSLPSAPLGLGPAASRWMSWADDGAADAGGITCHEHDRDEPLFFLPPDIIAGPPAIITFTPDGQCATWGNPDGTVAACDFPELNRRLGEVAMGW
jgi:hypothetical protein